MTNEPHIVAVAAEAVIKQSITDFTFLGYADPEHRYDRAWGTLLKAPALGGKTSRLTWQINLADARSITLGYQADAGCDQDGRSDLKGILSPQWVKPCIVLTEIGLLEELQEACDYWEHSLQVYRVPGKLRTAGNPYPSS